MRLISALLVASALMPMGANALTLGNATPTLTQVRENIQARWNAHCDILESRIDTRVTRYDNNAAHHQEANQKIREIVQAIITKLEAKGADVTQLTADLQTLDTKLAKFSSDYAAYIQALKDSKQFACGSSQGQFATAYTKAVSLLPTVQQDNQDIMSFYQKTIRPDINTIREQLKPQAKK